MAVRPEGWDEKLNPYRGEAFEAGADAMLEALKEKGMNESTVILGGTIPPDDIPKLKDAGIAEVFGPGTPLERIVNFVSGAQ